MPLIFVSEPRILQNRFCQKQQFFSQAFLGRQVRRTRSIGKCVPFEKKVGFEPLFLREELEVVSLSSLRVHGATQNAFVLKLQRVYGRNARVQSKDSFVPRWNMVFSKIF